MKAALIALFFVASAFAQAQSSALPAACGPTSMKFDVKLEESHPTQAQPAPGNATVYFVQDRPTGNGVGISVTRIGLDGAWVGAFQHNSYFSVSVNPGEHHLCVNPQSRTSLGKLVGLARFTAEAGKVYYFRTRARSTNSATDLKIEAVDSDQARYLIASSPLSLSTARK
jgi:hypothetical protein